jgi:transposase
VNKNDPNDARSVAVAALRSASPREVAADDHAAVLKVWSERYRDLGRARTQVACRLHAARCELVPGGVSKRISAAQAALLESITPSGTVAAARCELAAEFLEDLRRIDAQMRRFASRDHFAAYNGTAPIEVSSGRRKIYRLPRRGNRRLNHARGHPGQPPPQRRPRGLRAEAGRGQDPQRGPAFPETAPQRQICARLQADARRAAAGPR